MHCVPLLTVIAAADDDAADGEYNYLSEVRLMLITVSTDLPLGERRGRRARRGLRALLARFRYH